MFMLRLRLRFIVNGPLSDLQATKVHWGCEYKGLHILSLLHDKQIGWLVPSSDLLPEKS